MQPLGKKSNDVNDYVLKILRNMFLYMKTFLLKLFKYGQNYLNDI